MKKIVYTLAIYLLLCSSVLASAEQLAYHLHQSFTTASMDWHTSTQLLATEKEKIRPLYSHALKILNAWYNINGQTEEAILDGLAKEAGYAINEKTRWQISALIVASLDMQKNNALVQGGSRTSRDDTGEEGSRKGSSSLYKIWRVLKGSWHVLLIVAFAVYYGWDLFAKLLPQLAQKLKKLLPQKWWSRAAHDGTAPYTREKPEEEERKDDDDAVPRFQYDLPIPAKDATSSSSTDWRQHAGALSTLPPPPPDAPGDDEVEYVTADKTWVQAIVDNREVFEIGGRAFRDVSTSILMLSRAFTQGPTEGIVAGVAGGIRAGMRGARDEDTTLVPVRRAPDFLALPAPDRADETALVPEAAMATGPDERGATWADKLSSPYVVVPAAAGALYGAYRLGSRQATNTKKTPPARRRAPDKPDDRRPDPGQSPREK